MRASTAMRRTAMRRHDFDPVAFAFGLVFTGLGVLFLIGRFDLFNHARWLWPGLLVVLGLAVLVGARGRGSHGTERNVGAADAVDLGPPPDLDSIEPPVGPEAFRLPGWPAPSAESKAETAEVEPVGSGTEVLPAVEARPDPEAETEILRPRRPQEPPPSG
jgi:hypothetical protein